MEFENEEFEGEYQYKTEDLLGTKKEERRRIRQEKRRIKHYKFSDKKHPVTAKISLAFGIACIAVFIWAVIYAVIKQGMAGIEVGYAGLGMFVFSFAGVILSIIALAHRDVKTSIAWSGLLTNGLLWIVLFCLILIKVEVV